MHRRRRHIDIEVMWLSLVERADTIADARVAWEVFLLQERQEHWQCGCGKMIAELFRNVTFQIKEE
jgi:hypothetical protein